MLLTEILVTGYAFVIGACVGSFLNVVAWRLPLGMSLIKPASHCPQCKTPIRFRDNVPVLGWILLRGRCRACGCWISPRYPLVEFFVGVAFALLAWFELATAQFSLPPRSDSWRWISPRLPFDWVCLELWLYHVTLVSLLVTITLVELDRARLRRWFFVFAFCAGFLPPLVLPELRTAFLSERLAQSWTTATAAQQALRYLTFSAALGACLGWSFAPRRADRNHVILLSAALSAVGLFLGGIVFGVASDVAVILVLLRLLAIWFPKLLAVPRTAIVLVTTLIVFRDWPIYRFEGGLRPQSMLNPLVFVFVATVLMAFVNAISARRMNRLKQ